MTHAPGSLPAATHTDPLDLAAQLPLTADEARRISLGFAGDTGEE